MAHHSKSKSKRGGSANLNCKPHKISGVKKRGAVGRLGFFEVDLNGPWRQELNGHLQEMEETAEFHFVREMRRQCAPHDPFEDCWSAGFCDCDECRSDLDPRFGPGTPLRCPVLSGRDGLGLLAIVGRGEQVGQGDSAQKATGRRNLE